MFFVLTSFGAQAGLIPFESMQQPEWPAKAVAMKAEGIVQVELVIDNEGNVTSHSEKTEDEAGKLFLSETTRAVSKWKAAAGHAGTYTYKVVFRTNHHPEIQN